ncbi:MAG: hypothetical protein AAGL90_03440 [Pseudomonadota bacterium]
MALSLQTLLGLVMIAIGGVKTWLHVGSVPVLALQTCNGQTLQMSLDPSHGLLQAHCWGCYLVLAGLVVVGQAAWRAHTKRRTVAYRVD